MALEDKIGELIAVNKALIAALQGKAGGAAATAAGKPAATAAGKPAATAPKAPKNTAADVTAAAVKVKKELSVEAAKFLIAKHGADELKALMPAAYDDFVADCNAAIEAGEVEGMDGGSDDL